MAKKRVVVTVNLTSQMKSRLEVAAQKMLSTAVQYNDIQQKPISNGLDGNPLIVDHKLAVEL